jgi:serine/threonine-protein kinase RsbW
MQFLKPLIGEFQSEDGSDVDIELAVREAIANAVIHGNHENPQRRVEVTCSCSIDAEVSITVRDRGQGFDNRAFPDPADPANRLLTHGRGIRLMQALMDEVELKENGTVVRMRKRLVLRVEKELHRAYTGRKT